MIPYFEPPPPLSLFGFRLPGFGLLLFLSVLATHAVIVHRARVLGAGPGSRVAPETAGRFAKVLLLAAVGGAHVGGIFTDHGLSALGHPSLFVSTQSAFSSAGGIVGAAVAGGLYLVILRCDLRAWADVVALAFPVGLFVARAGCALAHDHLGRPSTSWLAVRFPDGARLDCGLLEWLAAPFLIALAVALIRRRPPAGLSAGVIAASYAILRFSLDFLRAIDIPGADSRHLGLTFAQWICLPLFAASLYLVVTAGRGAPASPSPRP